MDPQEFADKKPEPDVYKKSTNDDDLRTQGSELRETMPQLESESTVKKRNEKDEGEKLTQLEKQLRDKDEELDKTKSELESTKQYLKEKEDEFKKKELECLQGKEEKLKQLEKQLRDKDEELDNTKSELESTKQYLKEKEDEFKKKELECLQGKEEKLKQLEKQLRDKDEELDNTKSELESSKQYLKKPEDELIKTSQDLKENNDMLEELQEQLRCKDRALCDSESRLDSTRQLLQERNDMLEQSKKQFVGKAKELEEMKSKLKVSEEALQEKVRELLKQGEVFSKCCSRWDMDCTKKEQAVEEAKQLRVTKEKDDEVILGLQREKARLQWRHAFRLTCEQQWKSRVRAVVSAQCEEVKGQLTSISREHESERKRLQDQIQSQNLQLCVAGKEWQTQEARLTDRIEHVEVEKAELADKVTHCELQLKEREGSVLIAKAWVQRLSEQCEANERNLEELARTRTTLRETEAQYLDILGKLQKEQHDAVQLRLKLDSETRLNIALSNTAQREDKDVRQEQERIALLKEEIDRAEQALRDAYRRNEEKCEELKTNRSEKMKLVRHSLNLRRQLDAMTDDKERLRVKCNHLEFELVQSPQHSSPNNTNGGNVSGPDLAVHALDQLSPVHHSPDFWTRQDADSSWWNMDGSYIN